MDRRCLARKECIDVKNGRMFAKVLAGVVDKGFQKEKWGDTGVRDGIMSDDCMMELENVRIKTRINGKQRSTVFGK